MYKFNLLIFLTCLILSRPSFAGQTTYSLDDIITTQTKQGATIETLNVNVVNYFLNRIADHAMMYPPRFKDQEERKRIEYELNTLIAEFKTINPYYIRDADVLATYGLALTYAFNLEFQGSGKEADDILKYALSIDPENAYANYTYALFLSNTTSDVDSIPYFEKAIKNGIKKAKFDLAMVYYIHNTSFEKVERLMNEYAEDFADEPSAQGLFEAWKKNKLRKTRQLRPIE